MVLFHKGGFMLLWFFALMSCASTSDTGDVLCPTMDEDNCMTEELLEQCLAVTETCDGEVIRLESCPYAGFECSE